MSPGRPRLTIRALRARAVEVPMRRPLGTSAARMTQAPFVLVEIDTHEGVTGRAHAFCYLSEAAPMIGRCVELAGEVVTGAPVEPAAIARRLESRFRLLGAHGVVAMALSAIDVACWDALATAAGVPLAALLGATRTAVPAYNSNGLSLMPPADVGAEATALLERGLPALKIRLGRADAAEDLAAVRAVGDAVPAGTALMADFNQALSVGEAIERGKALDELGLVWLEEPVAAGDLLGSARVAAALTTSVQLGENFYGPHAVAAAIAERAADCLMLDLMRIGGVTGWLEAARLAADAGIPISSHLYPEVSVHLLAASATAHWLEYVDWAEPLLAGGIEVADGQAIVPSRPGCGVEWDDAAVERYAMR
jgi:mandelate racemase